MALIRGAIGFACLRQRNLYRAQPALQDTVSLPKGSLPKGSVFNVRFNCHSSNFEEARHESPRLLRGVRRGDLDMWLQSDTAQIVETLSITSATGQTHRRAATSILLWYRRCCLVSDGDSKVC